MYIELMKCPQICHLMYDTKGVKQYDPFVSDRQNPYLIQTDLKPLPDIETIDAHWDTMWVAL